MREIWESTVVAILVIWGVLSTIFSVMVVLEVVGVTSYGIWPIVGYGILTFIIGWVVLGLNLLFIAMNP